ncbi:hypothetical protein [Anaeromusa sp.]|uniref:hypothetical protein n=1 Tax=Anaeromusa sp. TaxID=1872520 RepID=UPI0029C952CB|nr:hypothetical protein [Anaeromusa sp.]MEA4834002.1 hypothetical protein [Anaeromusa sp.]
MKQCPTCAFPLTAQAGLRCPRCRTLLVTPCGGSCSKCRQKEDCKQNGSNS